MPRLNTILVDIEPNWFIFAGEEWMGDRYDRDSDLRCRPRATAAAHQFQERPVGESQRQAGAGKVGLQRMLWAALEISVEELERAQPETSLGSMARRMVLDAAKGRMPAVREILSQLDKGCESEVWSAKDSQEETVDEVEANSLK
jgi:hypothetical protein